MPAAAVIPAPIGYINAVAVKKLVVEFLGGFVCCLKESESFSLGSRLSSCGNFCLFLCLLKEMNGPLSH